MYEPNAHLWLLFLSVLTFFPPDADAEAAGVGAAAGEGVLRFLPDPSAATLAATLAPALAPAFPPTAAAGALVLVVVLTGAVAIGDMLDRAANPFAQLTAPCIMCRTAANAGVTRA